MTGASYATESSGDSAERARDGGGSAAATSTNSEANARMHAIATGCVGDSSDEKALKEKTRPRAAAPRGIESDFTDFPFPTKM